MYVSMTTTEKVINTLSLLETVFLKSPLALGFYGFFSFFFFVFLWSFNSFYAPWKCLSINLAQSGLFAYNKRVRAKV